MVVNFEGKSVQHEFLALTSKSTKEEMTYPQFMDKLLFGPLASKLTVHDVVGFIAVDGGTQL